MSRPNYAKIANDMERKGKAPRVDPIGPNYWESGHCPGCGWTYDLHPPDAEGVDVGRCPTADEQARMMGYYLSSMNNLHRMALNFPRAKPR